MIHKISCFSLGFLAVAILACSSSVNAQIVSYSQNFEGLDINDTSTDPLGNDGWLVGAKRF